MVEVTRLGRRYRRQNKRVAEDEVRNKINAAIAASLAGKKVYAGDTMADLLKRHCREAFRIAEENCLILEVDLPENQEPAPFKSFAVFFVLRPVFANITKH